MINFFVDNPEHLLEKDYYAVVTEIYSAMPVHQVEDLERHEINKYLMDYAGFHSYLSRMHAIILINYNSHIKDKYKVLKPIVEQAISVVKFQYDVLSRRITVNKSNEDYWSKLT